MGVYVINFAAVIFTGLVAQLFSERRAAGIFFCSCSWLQLTLIAALRWSNGLDYNQYYNSFFSIANAESWSDVLKMRYEIGYLFINRIVSHITANIIVYMFIFHGLMYALLLFYVYKYVEMKWLAVAAFVAFDYYALSLCFMRQSMAMVIGLFAIEMIKKRKWYFAVLFILFASLFHASALILLVCLAISFLDFSKKKVWITAVMLSVGIYFGSGILLQYILVGPFAKYRDYLESRFMNGNHFLVVFYPVFVFALVLCFYKRLCKEDKQFKSIFAVLFFGTVLSILSTKHYIIERMALYITIYNIRVVAQILALFKSKMQKWNYQLAVYCAVFISIGAFAFGIKNDRYGISPFELNRSYLYDVDFFKDGA